jgi:hypothetical protein
MKRLNIDNNKKTIKSMENEKFLGKSKHVVIPQVTITPAPN